MKIADLNKHLTYSPCFVDYLTNNMAALCLAEIFGLDAVRIDGTVYTECEDGFAEVYFLNRNQTMRGVREAQCPGL